MAGWHSLSGYLQYKSGNALGRLITKRKVWCVMEESKCQLHYYKSEEEMHKQRVSQGHIDINGAAISLDLENQNQFVVLSDGKEHYFTAENHESMMIWLLGLQAKRDIYSKKVTSIKENEDAEYDPFINRRSSDHSVWSRPNLFMTLSSISQPLDDCSVSQSPKSLNPRSFRWEKYEFQKLGESVDSGLGVCKRTVGPTKSLPLKTSRSVPLASKGFASRSAPVQYSPPGKTRVRRHHHCSISKMSGSPTTSTGSYDSDDVFDETMKYRRHKGLSRHWRKLQSAVMSHRLPFYVTVDPVWESRYSSRSASSDSAIEKGESSPLELANRLAELESELISTKCELAKVMNQQTCFQELLQHKDQAIKSLERKAGATHMNGSLKKDSKTSSPKLSKHDRDFHEKIRVLQNQNRFLNEEVKKLARIRLQEHGKYQEQNLKLHSLEADIEKWKMDYVTLIQSSIRFPGEEGTDDLELSLYGGDKHKNRVKALLEEARKINPRLPTYDSLTNNEVHVDTYGFKHVYINPGLRLHYLCTELTHHYLVQAGVYEEHQKQWIHFMRQHGKSPMKSAKDLKLLCRGGIPDRFRKQVWHHLVHYHVRELIQEKGEYYYRNLCNLLPESPLASCYRKQVSLDLMRTMPSNIKFAAQGSKGIMDLQDVLLAFCIHNPTVGYCQGMNFIVGMALIFMDAQDAFWMLVAIAELYFSPHYFDHSLIGAQSDQQVLKDMVKEKLPDLYNHLDSIDIELSTITLNWFLAVFFDAVPFQTLLRIWDCFLLEGPKVLFRFSLAILKLHEKDILKKTDTMGIMKHLKSCAKLTYDVDGLVKLAFEGLKPFPKRRDIQTKQTCYLNTLKEKHKKKELQRLAFAEREQLYMSMEAEAGIFMGIECAVSGPDGKVWLCYGDQHIGRLSCVSCDQSHMTSLNWKLDSRLMCMCAMSPDKLVLGTISWMLLAFNITRRDPDWQIQLHDAILSVCCYEDENLTTRIFSGLADGTVAVVEQQYKKTEPNIDVLYIPIGQAPVTCLTLQGEQLWCASGNTVVILHAKTLDTMDILSVSVNPYDHILSLVPGDFGIWVTLRGSSILELWDPKLLCCRMLYDTRTDRYPHLKKEDDVYFNRARITSILANGDTVWVGTGEGNLIIYEVTETSQIKTPIVMSPSMENLSSVTCRLKEGVGKELDSNDVNGRLLKVDNMYRRFLEHTDSLEVQFSPSSPSPVEYLRDDLYSPSQESTDHDDDAKKLNPIALQKAKIAYNFGLSECNNVNTGKVVKQKQVTKAFKYTNQDGYNTVENNTEQVSNSESKDVQARTQKEDLATMNETEQTQLQDNHDERSDASTLKPVPSSKRESVECCFQAAAGTSHEAEELENPLEQVYEAEARSSFSHVLLELEEVDHLQKIYNEHTQSKRKYSKPSLKKRRSENDILPKPMDHQSDPEIDAEDLAFESKMEEYARRHSSSHVIHVEDFTKLQKIYEQSMEEQTGSRKTSGEISQNRLQNAESFDSTSNSSMLLDKDEFEKLQVTYDEAVTSRCGEENTDNETLAKQIKKKNSSVERKAFGNNSSCFVDERDDFDKQIIYDDTVPRKRSDLKEHSTTHRRRSSSEVDIKALERAMDDSQHRQSQPQQTSSRAQAWTRVRRKSSSENDLSMRQKEMSDALECQGRSESLIKCDNMARDEELYEEKLEREACIETLDKNETLTPTCDIFSPSSSEFILTPNSDTISCVSEEHLETMPLTEEKTELYQNLIEICKECVAKGTQCCNCIEKIQKTYAEYKQSEEAEISSISKKLQQALKQNGISDELNVRLCQNYNHSEANLDLKSALDVLNHVNAISSEQKKCNKGFDLETQEQHSSLVANEIPNKEFKRINDPSEGKRRSSKQMVNGLNYERQFSAESATEISRQEKVGIWLSSISSDPDRSNSDTDTVYLKSQRKIPTDSSDDDVFFSAREKAQDSNSDCKSDKQTHASSRTKAYFSDKQVHKKGKDVQYHLEFSNIHVETESEKEGSEVRIKKTSIDETSLTKMAKLGSSDKRKTSLDLGSIQEKCNWFYDSFLGKRDSSGIEEDDSASSRASDRQKIFEYLRTPSIESRRMSLGPKISEDDLECKDLYPEQFQFPSLSGNGAAESKLPFLKTLSASSHHSSLYSSYENISTTNEQDLRFLTTLHHRGHISHSVSSGSISSDNGIIYNVDLTMEAKMKISDKPVKCLLTTSTNNEPLIISCSGSYGDDEAVLKWKKHLNEQLWTNEPILEFCPKTKMKILPMYMTRRGSSTSSFHSHGSEDSVANMSSSSFK